MDYIELDDQNFHEKIPPKSGVYKIYSLDRNRTPKKLRRLFEDDKEGVLYIGQSKNLKARLRMLYRVLHPELDYKATAHTFGKKYKELEILKKHFSLNTLAITYELINGTHKDMEKELIRKYAERFGEVPPLNSSF